MHDQGSNGHGCFFFPLSPSFWSLGKQNRKGPHERVAIAKTYEGCHLVVKKSTNQLRPLLAQDVHVRNNMREGSGHTTPESTRRHEPKMEGKEGLNRLEESGGKYHPAMSVVCSICYPVAAHVSSNQMSIIRIKKKNLRKIDPSTQAGKTPLLEICSEMLCFAVLCSAVLRLSRRARRGQLSE
jgi:hypothetical protein